MPRLSAPSFEQGGAGVHRPGGHQHLGDKDLIGAEFDTHPIHAGQQALGQDILGGETLLQRLLDVLHDQLLFAFFQGVADFDQNTH